MNNYDKDIEYLLRKMNSPETSFLEVQKIQKQLQLLEEARDIYKSISEKKST